LSIWLTDHFGTAPYLFNAARFLVIFLLILVPTTLMGATLPILSQLVLQRHDRIGQSLGSLYATNTIGAVVGCLLAGFFLIGSIGIHNSIYLAAFLNIAVGAASRFLANRAGAEASAKTQKVAKKEKSKRAKPADPLALRLQILLLGGFAVSGVTAFAYEVLWTRSLIFVVGNSTYAFTIMLTTFLVGIALGGYGVRFFVDRLKNPLHFFAWVQVAIGISAACAMPLLGAFTRLPIAREWLAVAETGEASVLAIRFAASFVVMLIPTLLIGMTFPLAGKILVRNIHRSGAEVGKVYAVNTLGNIVGALLPAFLLVPLLGIQRGILTMAAVNIGVGLVILAYGRFGGSPFRHLTPVAVMVLIGLAATLPRSPQFPSNSQEAGDTVLFYKEGIAATTKVFQKPSTGEKHISVDGIQIGGSDPMLDYKQQWLAHLPKLLLDDYETELSVGLGSGILVGESARHEGLKKIVCLEIAPSVVEAAAYFEEENYRVLDSPKVEVVVNDAVNTLLTSRDTYDIISTDGKTKPEYGVNGVFFSKEYYTLMRDHLEPGGIAIQWIPIHYPPDIFKTVLNTFCCTFPHALIWYGEGNCFLVGSNESIDLDPDAIERKLSDPNQPYDGLRKFGISSASSLLGQLISAEDAVLNRSSAGSPLAVNSLERPIIEFYDFSDYQLPRIERERHNLEFLLSLRGQGRISSALNEMPESVQVAHEATGIYFQGQRLVFAEARRSVLEPYFDRALATDPDNPHLRYQISGHYLETGITLMEQKKWDRAEIYLKRGVELWPDDADIRYRYGFVLMKLGRGEEALREYEASLKLAPERLSLRKSLADTYLLNKMIPEAVGHYQLILEKHPRDAKALRGMGECLIAQKRFADALDYCQQAYELMPDDPEIIDSYAWAAFQSGNRELSREIVRKGGNYLEHSESIRHRLDLILKEPELEP
jgi:spermidine synthase